MRRVTCILLLACALLAPAATAAERRPRPLPRLDVTRLETAGTGVRVHVEVRQARGAVRSVRVRDGRRRIALRAVRRRAERTVWHSAAIGGAAAERLRAATAVTVELQVGRRTLVRRTALRRPPARSGSGAPAAQPGPGLTVTTDPVLVPAFGAGVTDHVVRCDAGTPVRLAVTAGPATPVAVGGGAPRSGTWDTTIPLAPGRRFTIAADGVTHHVRCLPADFPEIAVERPGPPVSPSLLVTPARVGAGRSYAVVLDGAGTPVWWMDAPRGALDLKALPDGDLAWSSFSGGSVGLDPAGAYEQRTLDGSLVRSLATVGVPTDHHDLQPLADGSVLLVAYRQRDAADLSPWAGPASATVLDPVVQEIRPDGSLAWEWDGRDDLALEESARFLALSVIAAPLADPGGGPDRYDTTHINSVEPDGDGVIVSMRHTDAVYRIDRASGTVDWKLGGTPTPESLTLVDDPLAATRFGGQHDARRQPDGTLTVFDNGTARGRAPQALRYAIDPAARTARLVEAIDDPLAPASPCCGSARPLAGGGWVIAWGGTRRVTVVDRDATPVLALTLPGPIGTYRAVPVPADVLTADALRAGMDAIAARG